MIVSSFSYPSLFVCCWLLILNYCFSVYCFLETGCCLPVDVFCLLVAVCWLFKKLLSNFWLSVIVCCFLSSFSWLLLCVCCFFLVAVCCFSCLLFSGIWLLRAPAAKRKNPEIIHKSAAPLLPWERELKEKMRPQCISILIYDNFG